MFLFVEEVLTKDYHLLLRVDYFLLDIGLDESFDLIANFVHCQAFVDQVLKLVPDFANCVLYAWRAWVRSVDEVNNVVPFVR